MGIKFHCPNGHKLNVKSFLAGKKGVCPKCGTKVRIPAVSEGDAADSDIGGAAVAAGAAASVANGAGHALPTSFSPRPASAPAVSAPAAAAPAVASPAIPVGMPVAPRPAAPSAPLPGLPLPASPLPAPALPAGGMPAMPAPGVAMPLPPAAAGDPIAEAPAATWYVRPPSGGQYGPARGDVMRKWIAEGRVSGDSLVWREGWADWKNASQLFPNLAAAAGTAGPISTAPITPTVARSTSRYQTKKKSGTGMAIAFLVVLGIVCVVLVGVLVYVLMNVK